VRLSYNFQTPLLQCNVSRNDLEASTRPASVSHFTRSRIHKCGNMHFIIFRGRGTCFYPQY
jgi:hypothetical protein